MLDELRDGELEVRISNPGIDDLAHHMDVAVNRIAVALVILGGLVGSSLIGVLAKGGPHLMGLHLLSRGGLRPLRRVRRLAALGRLPLRTFVGVWHRQVSDPSTRRRVHSVR